MLKPVAEPLAASSQFASSPSTVSVLMSNAEKAMKKTPAEKGPSEGSTYEDGNSRGVLRKSTSRISTYIKREEDRFDGTMMELMKLRDRK